MAYVDMADGRAYYTDAPYAALRGAIFEDKFDPIPGVTYGPGNPPDWIELVVQGGYITFTRAQVVAIHP